MPVALKNYQAQQASVVALGTFDGVHLGHLALLKLAKQQAAHHSLTSLAFTFAHPPGNFLGYPKPLLLPPEHKYRLIESVVDQAIIAEFPDLAEMRPESFVAQVLKQRLQAKGVVVGADYRFGKDRAGGVNVLKSLGTEFDFDVFEIAPVEHRGEVVSSTRIRQAIRAGHIETATQLLRHPPLLVGQVVPGEGRGKSLGFPTANLAGTESFVCPEQGIFAGVTCLKDAAHPASIYIGTKPTFEGHERVIEVHLLQGEFPPLYDRTLTVHLIKKIRNDEAFADAETLSAQIQADVDSTSEVLASVDLSNFCSG